ncbi:uncharacterized protein LOC112030602 [Quercus suber]|uniref:Uncharacterized protein n=1 Tax=Quercus suber TaxID=58331 RepID=A0AAW0KVI8_QUESU|nr:uncharacterized protein LOC112030602 [Quercus suber]POF02074.1 hypothetical protein CFP56_65324 [Quercus suber]
MAGAHCATTTLSLLTPPINPTVTRPKARASASLPLPLPKPTQRKNYLRPKILKTLTKPTSNPVIPIVSPETESPDIESPTDETSTENRAADIGETVEEEEFRSSETPATAADGIVGKLSARSVLKYGAYLVGLFVFQTICSVWILGKANSDSVKDGNLDSSDNNRKKNSSSNKEKVLFGSDSELEMKIEEIRAMAREARRSEKNAGKEGGEDDEFGEESLISKRRIGIEKEIGAKLSKLQKRLNSNLANKVEDKVKRGNSDSKDANGTLMFKKKLKFKSPPMKVRNGSKGFGGTKDRIRNVDNGKKSGSKSVEDDRRKLRGQESLSDLGNAQQRNGRVVPKTDSERSSVEVVNSQQSVKFETQHSHKFTNGNEGTASTSDNHAVFSMNGNSKHREIGDEPLANKFREKQPNTESDFWWLRLPHVLAILMRRDSDHEGQGGLYTLKIAPEAQEQRNCYTVAFEDRVDASNFCFLLESFFEDLGDFSADVVPLPVKELHEAVSDGMKVIVVKKRQLQLYAGQPFADVETALHSLVEGDQSASSTANSR